MVKSFNKQEAYIVMSGSNFVKNKQPLQNAKDLNFLVTGKAGVTKITFFTLHKWKNFVLCCCYLFVKRFLQVYAKVMYLKVGYNVDS